jgi:multiple sugar transport system substrate-binding protein/sn-glycerol 3-phosphate transport system substrate-binding protein
LALLLAILASLGRDQKTPTVDTNPYPVLPHTASSTLGSTPAQSQDTPTLLPGVASTPDEYIPSLLGVSATDLSGIQVSLWHPWTGSTGSALQAILDEFNRTNQWGITVNASSYEGFGKLDDAVEAALSTDSLPDVLVDYGYLGRHWDNNNILVDLTPYVNDPVWGFTSDEQNDFIQVFWEEDLVSAEEAAPARRLGIPFYRSAYVMFYNQSWGSELGYLKPPVSAVEFRERACAAADYVARQEGKSDPGRGGWLVTPQPGVMAGWIYAFGGRITDPGGQGYLFNTPETMQALQFLKGLQESGCAWTESGLDPQSEFANRQALFMVGSLFDIATQQQAFVQAGSSDEWIVIPYPSNTEPVVDSYGPSLFITQSSPGKQLASWLLIEWLVNPPNQAEWATVLQAYPTRLSAMNYLPEVSSTNPQWLQALELIPAARSEPTLASWRTVRWTLEDAMMQLLVPPFGAEQIPTLLEDLDSVAAVIVTQVR